MRVGCVAGRGKEGEEAVSERTRKRKGEDGMGREVKVSVNR